MEHSGVWPVCFSSHTGGGGGGDDAPCRDQSEGEGCRHNLQDKTNMEINLLQSQHKIHRKYKLN